MSQNFRDNRLDAIQESAIKEAAHSSLLQKFTPKKPSIKQQFDNSVDQFAAAYYYTRNRAAVGLGIAAISLGGLYAHPDIKTRIDEAIDESQSSSPLLSVRPKPRPFR